MIIKIKLLKELSMALTSFLNNEKSTIECFDGAFDCLKKYYKR